MKPAAGLLVGPHATIRDAIKVIDAQAQQIVLVVDGDRRLLGTVTDGDVRRGLLAGLDLGDRIDSIMNPTPTTASPDENRERVLAWMKARKIHQVPVLDAERRVLGIEILDELLVRGPVDNPVILLAGGKGLRLRPITEHVPKPLIEVGGRPILERIVGDLRDAGFRRFYLSVGYRADMIVDHFGDGSAFGVQVDYLTEDSPLGTGGALGLLPESPSTDFLVMNGDLLTAVDARALLAFHKRSSGEATMCVRGFEHTVPYGVVNRDGDRFVGIEEKPVQSFFVNAGIYALSPSVLDLVERGARLDMPELFTRIQAAGRHASVYHLREYWLDIGLKPQLDQAHDDVQEHFET
jgi:dTDP-glucose pyrophosphorylase